MGVPTGFAELDEVTNGLHAGQMIIVAARPGSGSRLWHWTYAVLLDQARHGQRDLLAWR